MINDTVQTQEHQNTFSSVVLRLVTSAVILAIAAFFTPGFNINSIWALILAAIVLTVIDFLINKFTGLRASPFGKGIVGFLLAAFALYATQYFVIGYSVSWISAILGALIYGVVDFFIPEQQ